MNPQVFYVTEFFSREASGVAGRLAGPSTCPRGTPVRQVDAEGADAEGRAYSNLVTNPQLVGLLWHLTPASIACLMAEREVSFCGSGFEAMLRKQLVMPRPTDWLVCVERSVGLLSFARPSTEGAI
jgi:hypothetical protein